MKKMPDMATVMTPFPETVSASASLEEAKQLMYAKNIRHLPVTEDDRLVGVLSDRDVKLAIAVHRRKSADIDLTVADACHFEAYTVDHDERANEVVEHMAKNRIGSALVTRNGKLVGIFTTTDVCRLCAEVLHRAFPDA